MELPNGGYAPKDDGTKPGTPPTGPAGASSANTRPEATCACDQPCGHAAKQEG